MSNIGIQMYQWASDLYPICRSITGPGIRQTLSYINNLIPEMTIHQIASGTQAFDWIVPNEWTIHDAYIEDETGNRVVDFKQHNLHVVGYSEPVDLRLTLDELEKHLYSLPDQPEAIPYITSYYSRTWGFCLKHNQRKSLLPGLYHAVIVSNIKPGFLNYGEVILPGLEEKEVFLSTYVCHPSMANNELSGPVVTTALVKWLQSLKNRRYTYRIVFIPETIGSIVYLSLNSKKMMKMIIAGFNVTCVGDDRSYSFLPSRKGNTLADRVAQHVLKWNVKKYVHHSFLDRGSDERQYCSPSIDLPIVSIMRTKYGAYPEYHTSLDNLSLISPEGLEGSYEILRKCIIALEMNYHYRITTSCEPQLGKRGLYPTLSTKKIVAKIQTMKNLITYADGKADLIEIADTIDANITECAEIVKRLEIHGLLEIVEV